MSYLKFTPKKVHSRLNLAYEEGRRNGRERLGLNLLGTRIENARRSALEARKVLVERSLEGAFVPGLALCLDQVLEAEALVFQLETTWESIVPDVILEAALPRGRES